MENYNELKFNKNLKKERIREIKIKKENKEIFENKSYNKEKNEQLKDLFINIYNLKENNYQKN